jgi:hypothetical protein
MNIEQLKAQVEAVSKANAEKIRVAAEVARLEATLKLESSPALFAAKVRIAANGGQTAKLQKMVSECEAIVAGMPINNPKTRTARKWAGAHRFGYGPQVDLMYQLATGILYACADHKQLLLAHTGLDLEVIEQVVEAFGAPTYYSRNYNTVVEAKPYCLELVTAVVDVMQSELGVVVDTSKLTKEQFEYEFVRAENTAATALAQAEEAIAGADLQM